MVADDVPPADGPYQWLVPNSANTRPAESDPVKAMVYLRDAIEEMPETKATFTVNQIIEDMPFTSSWVHPRMLEYMGSWRVPIEYPGGGVRSADRWVNPQYPTRYNFTDVVANCECGAVDRRCPRGKHADRFAQSFPDHTDDCRQQWVADMRAELHRKRRRVVITGMRFWNSARSTAERLGVSEDTVQKITADTGVDVEAERENGRRRAGKTAIELTGTYKQTDIADALGVTPKTIQSMIKEYDDDYEPTVHYEDRVFQEVRSDD